MQKIANDIKQGRFVQVYLLCGEEDYLRKQYRDRLTRALSNPDDTMNYHYFEGKDISPEKLIDIAETMPFLAPRRLLVVENSGFFKSSPESLAQYMGELPETTTFIFVERQVDKRARLYKACKDNGYIAEFKAQDEQLLKRWVLGILQKEGKRITERALEEFLERTGTDMENISAELEKLICYTMEKDDISGQDVEEICTRQLENRIFDMVEKVAQKQQREALDLYYDLISLKEPPMRILFLISRQFNLLYQTKLLRLKGYDSKSIAAKLSLPPFIASKYMAQSSKFKQDELRVALEECVQSEEFVKTGRVSDVLAVELLIIKFSTKE